MDALTETVAWRAAIPVFADVRMRLPEISVLLSSSTIPHTFSWNWQFCIETFELAALKPNSAFDMVQ